MMVVTLNAVQEGELWSGFVWEIQDENKLAELLARVAIGQARVAERILNEDGLVGTSYPKSGYQAARNLLQVGPSGDQSHRDGWIFQVISWIAAHATGNPNIIIRPPHIRHADKGLDGLLIEFEDNEVARVVISEDKATRNAREMVRDHVWPEFQNFETGNRDAELIDGVSMLLTGNRYPEPDEVVAALLWEEKRAYRVAVTINASNASQAGLKKLYKGYEGAVSGDINRRRVEAFQVDALRSWFEDIAIKATKIINAQEVASNV